jgi:hypothetical protein
MVTCIPSCDSHWSMAPGSESSLRTRPVSGLLYHVPERTTPSYTLQPIESFTARGSEADVTGAVGLADEALDASEWLSGCGTTAASLVPYCVSFWVSSPALGN